MVRVREPFSQITRRCGTNSRPGSGLDEEAVHFRKFQENDETIRTTCDDQELAIRLGLNELADLTIEIEQRARTTAVLAAAEHETFTPICESMWTSTRPGSGKYTMMSTRRTSLNSNGETVRAIFGANDGLNLIIKQRIR